MVPVSVRADDERASLGNRISFAFIDLPVDLHSPREQLERIHRQTQAFKRSGRPAGTEAVMGALGRLPAPLKTRAARLAASARVYNLTVSNVPGPREPVYMLGARLEEAYPVVPIAEDHSLSIGMFSYRDHVFFGAYADPTALPEAEALGPALNTAVLSLPKRAPRRRSHERSRTGTRGTAVRAAG
jgi:diacylglycerol O-acyltransferase